MFYFVSTWNNEAYVCLFQDAPWKKQIDTEMFRFMQLFQIGTMFTLRKSNSNSPAAEL